MVLDSSAVLAIAFDEPEAARLAKALAESVTRRISTVNWLEILMVLERRHGAAAADKLLLTLGQLNVEMVPFDKEHLFEAQRAWRKFGKGRHSAGLNMGDCCAYAAASIVSEPLLFKGSDLLKTDISPAEW